MPKVGNKEYPYTEQGMAAAETASDKSGEPVMRTYDAGGRVQRVKGYQEGGKLDRAGLGYERPAPSLAEEMGYDGIEVYRVQHPRDIGYLTAFTEMCYKHYIELKDLKNHQRPEYKYL